MQHGMVKKMHSLFISMNAFKYFFRHCDRCRLAENGRRVPDRPTFGIRWPTNQPLPPAPGEMHSYGDFWEPPGSLGLCSWLTGDNRRHVRDSLGVPQPIDVAVSSTEWNLSKRGTCKQVGLAGYLVFSDSSLASWSKCKKNDTFTPCSHIENT